MREWSKPTKESIVFLDELDPVEELPKIFRIELEHIASSMKILVKIQATGAIEAWAKLEYGFPKDLSAWKVTNMREAYWKGATDTLDWSV